MVGTTRVSTISSFLVGGIFGSESFGGLLDQIRVWNIARTETDVLNDYQSILSGNEAGLVGLWRLTSGEGQSAQDSTTNVLDLTLGSDSGVDANDPLWNGGSFPPSSEYTEIFNYGESGYIIGHDSLIGDVYQLQSTTNLSTFNWENRFSMTTASTARVDYYVGPSNSAGLFRIMSLGLP